MVSRVCAAVGFRRAGHCGHHGCLCQLLRLTTIAERKILGRMQNRFGPNRVGPWGLLQPLADGLKMITQGRHRALFGGQLLHFLAPLALAVPVWLAFAVIPFGYNMSAIDLDSGILFFFAIGSASELAVFMAGLVEPEQVFAGGGDARDRADDQLRSPLVLSTVPVLMMAGSLRSTK